MATYTVTYNETTLVEIRDAIQRRDELWLVPPAEADESGNVKQSAILIAPNWFEVQFKSEKNLFVFNSQDGYSWSALPSPQPTSEYVSVYQGTANAGKLMGVDVSGMVAPEDKLHVYQHVVWVSKPMTASGGSTKKFAFKVAFTITCDISTGFTKDTLWDYFAAQIERNGGPEHLPVFFPKFDAHGYLYYENETVGSEIIWVVTVRVSDMLLAVTVSDTANPGLTYSLGAAKADITVSDEVQQIL